MNQIPNREETNTRAIEEVVKASVNGFEAYLQEVHMSDNPMLLDDDIPDSYSDWIGNLDESDIFSYAVSYISWFNSKNNMGGKIDPTDAIKLTDTWREKNGL